MTTPPPSLKPEALASLVERLRAPAYWKSSDGYSEAFDNVPEQAATALEALAAERDALRHILEAITAMQALRYGDATRTHMALIGLCVTARTTLERTAR